MTTDTPPGVAALDDLLHRARTAFEDVHQRVFAGDPSANPRLVVETTEAAVVEGVPTLVLIAPWTLNGLIFPAAGGGPAELMIAGSRRRAFRGDVAPLGVYWSVNLVPDVSRLSSPRQARTLANSFAVPFRDAVRTWLTAGPATQS
ncbi:MAG TPA: [NiFe]-hydrogenase assembly chaperone HybE [Kineosporiaceae bacterium]